MKKDWIQPKIINMSGSQIETGAGIAFQFEFMVNYSANYYPCATTTGTTVTTAYSSAVFCNDANMAVFVTGSFYATSSAVNVGAYACTPAGPQIMAVNPASNLPAGACS